MALLQQCRFIESDLRSQCSDMLYSVQTTT
ncbi:hypothetical protein E3U36_10290 [Arsenophonus endosymbiont of Aphis craccivora]|nr:hypothetical protein E3U36_10290 [Arsenophonus endosymbiont of Aphis craccivora]